MEIEQERFEAWLFSQPPDRVFRWASTQHCAVCEFLNETQRLKATSGATFSRLWRGEPYTDEGCVIEEVAWPEWLQRIVVYFPINGLPLTVAGLQDRYRELFPDTTPEPTPAIVEAVRK